MTVLWAEDPSGGLPATIVLAEKHRGRVSAVDELLTAEEVAERLRTSPRFVRRLVAERRIPFTKIGKYVRIAAVDVEAFIAAGRVQPGPSYVRPTGVGVRERK